MKKILISIIILVMSMVSFGYTLPTLEVSNKMRNNTRYSSNVEVVGIVAYKNSIEAFVSNGLLLIKNPEANMYAVYEGTTDNLIIDYVYGGNIRISKDEIRPNYWMHVEGIKGWMADNNLVFITQEDAIKILDKQ